MTTPSPGWKPWSGEQRLDDPIQVRQLADAFDTALAAAVTGEAAVVLIRSTA
jgi:hypothetical protein